MLNKLVSKIDLRYFERMVEMCTTLKNKQWSDHDETSFRSKTLEEKLNYLRQWFCCSFCLIDENNCPVFKSVMEGKDV